MRRRACSNFVSLVDETAWVDELYSIECPAANIALIAPRILASIT